MFTNFMGELTKDFIEGIYGDYVEEAKSRIKKVENQYSEILGNDEMVQSRLAQIFGYLAYVSEYSAEDITNLFFSR